MHRAGLDEASPLKVREYLAHGLPVVLAFDDTDFHGRHSVVRPAAAEHGGQRARRRRRVCAFVEAGRGRRVARDEIAERVGRRAKEAAAGVHGRGRRPRPVRTRRATDAERRPRHAEPPAPARNPKPQEKCMAAKTGGQDHHVGGPAAGGSRGRATVIASTA